MSGICVIIHACHGAYHTSGPRSAIARHWGPGFSLYAFDVGSKSSSIGANSGNDWDMLTILVLYFGFSDEFLAKASLKILRLMIKKIYYSVIMHTS